jgi:hypothetical protein
VAHQRSCICARQRSGSGVEESRADSSDDDDLRVECVDETASSAAECARRPVNCASLGASSACGRFDCLLGEPARIVLGRAAQDARHRPPVDLVFPASARTARAAPARVAEGKVTELTGRSAGTSDRLSVEEQGAAQSNFDCEVEGEACRACGSAPSFCEACECCVVPENDRPVMQACWDRLADVDVRPAKWCCGDDSAAGDSSRHGNRDRSDTIAEHTRKLGKSRAHCSEDAMLLPVVTGCDQLDLSQAQFEGCDSPIRMPELENQGDRSCRVRVK